MPRNTKTATDSHRKASGIQVIARAASVLKILENEKNGLSLGEIANRIDLPRSTVQRIVNALAEENFVIKASPKAGVKLGPAILRMAANTNFDFANFVHPYLEELSQKLNETVDLSIRRGNQMVFVDQVSVSRRLSALSAVGESFNMHSSANGKAALAFMPVDEVEKLLSEELEPETEQTVTAKLSLMRQLNRIREQGFAVDDQEHTEGVSAVGVAFEDPLGRIFSVSVPVPTIRFERKEAIIKKGLLDLRENLLGAMSE